eukprot:TRINITY_DN81_c0_g1_i1.p1 TRINITY_DN81_c0_g1~~TRINITY_DN81_c0_g1_i1.p1  ORF type:complete len:390 (+),score=43.50 TRINITY_DN81_c0_g1_i1:83-1171(+)
MTIARFLLMCVATAHSYELGTPFQMGQSKSKSSNYNLAVDGNPKGFVFASDAVQFYDSDGGPQGDSQSVCPFGKGSIDVSLSSNYAIAVQANIPSAPAGVFGRFFDKKGVPCGFPFLVSKYDSEWTYTDPSVVATPDFALVAWGSTSYKYSTFQIGLRIYSPVNGNPVGHEFNITINSNNDVDVKVSGSLQSFFVCGLHDGTITGQMVSFEGQLLGDQFYINVNKNVHYFAVACGSKAYLVVWELESEIWGQFVDFSGRRIGENFRVATNNAVSPSVTATTTGFQVAWNRLGWIFSQSFGESGGAKGSEFMASHYTMNLPNGNFQPVVASSNNSIIFVTGSTSESIYAIFYGRIATGVPSSS